MSTPTPRTDDIAGSLIDAEEVVPADFARKLERELTTERARLDSGTILLTVAGERVWHCGVDLRAAIDLAMKEGGK